MRIGLEPTCFGLLIMLTRRKDRLGVWMGRLLKSSNKPGGGETGNRAQISVDTKLKLLCQIREWMYNYSYLHSAPGVLEHFRLETIKYRGLLNYSLTIGYQLSKQTTGYFTAMAAGRLARIVSLLLCVMVLLMTAQSRALRGQRSKSVIDNRGSRINTHRRSRRGSAESDLEQCTMLTAPWNEATGPVNIQEQLYRIRILSMSEDSALRTIFPEQPLFRFIRRVYRCCQMGYHCGSVKGIQGQLYHGKSSSDLGVGTFL